MASSVICIADSELQAKNIVANLRQSGFTNDDISVLLPDKTGTRDFAHEQHTKMPEGAATGAGAGGVAGATIGWLAGIGTLAIPGLGPFIAAGPILGALSGAAVGAAAGGLVGALVGMGIPEYEAKQYEGKVREGGILISVHCEDSDHTKAAKEVMRQQDARDIAAVGEKSVPDRDKPTAVVETTTPTSYQRSPIDKPMSRI